MVVTLFILGKVMLMCMFTNTGNFCVDVIGDSAVIVAAGGFEFVCEIFGITMYRKGKQ